MKFARIFLALFVLSLFSSYALAANKQIIKVGSNVTDANPLFSVFREVFIPYVESRTDGRYEFKLYPSGSLGAAKQRIQSMRNGMIQMDIQASSNMSQFAPELALLDMPYLFPDRESVTKLFKSDEGKKLLEPLYKNVSVHPLAIMMSTFRILGVTRPGTTLNELKGAKIRTSNSKEHITCINSLGLTATPMPMSEAFTGLQQKVIEGIDIEVPTFQETHLYEVANHLIKADYMPVIWMLTIYENLFKKMSPEDKKIFEEAATAYAEAVSKTFDDFEKKALEEMAAIPGVKVTRLTQEEKDEWKNFSAKAYDSLNDEQKEVIANIRKSIE